MDSLAEQLANGVVGEDEEVDILEILEVHFSSLPSARERVTTASTRGNLRGRARGRGRSNAGRGKGKAAAETSNTNRGRGKGTKRGREETMQGKKDSRSASGARTEREAIPDLNEDIAPELNVHELPISQNAPHLDDIWF